MSGLVEAGNAVEHDLTQSDLLVDLMDLINKGLPDEEIARRLGAEGPDEIAFARARLSELRNVQQQ